MEEPNITPTTENVEVPLKTENNKESVLGGIEISAQEGERAFDEADSLINENASIALSLVKDSNEQPDSELISLAQQTIDLGNQVKALKEAINPRTISQEHDPKGRVEVVGEAVTNKDERGVLEVEKAPISRKIQETVGQGEMLGKDLFTLEMDRRKILKEQNRPTHSVVEKIKREIRTRELDKLDIKIEIKRGEEDVLLNNQKDLESQKNEIEKKIQKIPTGKELLEAYYEKMESIPLSVQEKKELLKPEALAQLSTEEYIKLWKRLNPYYLSHVTRQGFRDHYAMDYHSSGLGEYQEGFLGIVEDGKTLRPPIFFREGGLKSRDEESVKRWMGEWVFEGDEKSALRRLNSRINDKGVASAEKYPDFTAVHFMAERVGDKYYGGERGNEIFFIYPTDVIASQHSFFFNGYEKNFTIPQGEDKWNDVFVWPSAEEDPGIILDAGLVFVPNSIPVDPITGSKYAHEVVVGEDGKEKKVLIEDSELIERFVNHYKEIVQNPKHEIVEASKAEDRSNYYDLVIKENASLGVPSDISAVVAKGLLSYFSNYGKEQGKKDNLLLALKNSNGQYKRAENPVPAREYWEKYFRENPEKCPKHVIFYDGDPTYAVSRFLRVNNIGGADTSNEEGNLLGFDENLIEEEGKDPRANKGKEELQKTGEKIIRQHYEGK